MTEAELRAIDAAVHTEVMGLGEACRCDVPNNPYRDPEKQCVCLTCKLGIPVGYSTNVSMAWRVMEYLAASEYFMVTGDPNDGATQLTFAVYPGHHEWTCCIWTANDDRCGVEKNAPTAPLAICLAALKTVRGPKA